MKHLLRAALLLLLVFAAQPARAIDSLYANKVYAELDVANATHATGPLDGVYAELKPGLSMIDLAFERTLNKLWPILRNSELHVYASSKPGAKRSKGVLQFVYLHPVTGQFSGSRSYTLDSGLNVIKLNGDSDYTYIELTNYGGGMGADSASEGFLIDAVYLLQDFASLSVRTKPLAADEGLTSVYPNPFDHARGTNLQVKLAQRSAVGVVVVDATGRVAYEANLGILPEGEHTVPVEIPEKGFYLARLVIDGVPEGRIVKLHAIQ